MYPHFIKVFSWDFILFFVCYIRVSVLSCIQLFVTPWTVARQAPLSTEFSTQGCWSRLPFPTLGDLPDPGVEPMPLVSLALAGRFVSLFLTLSVGFCAFDEWPPFPVLLEFCREVEPSVQFSHSVVSNSLRPHESQHARSPCPSQTPWVYSNPCPWRRWCHPALSSSVVTFSSCPQSLSASGSFPMSQLFTWGGQSIGVSASASVLPMNTQDWSPLEWTGWISLQSKGLSRVFSNTTVQKHQFFGAQLSSQSNSHIHMWPLEKP